MKLLHICLASFYIDNYSYQENMLPKYHKDLGFDVEILASLDSFDEQGKMCYLKEATSYLNEYNIPVTRLNYRKGRVNRKLRLYQGTYEALVKIKPEIIFIHGCQFHDIRKVIKFLKQNPNVKVYVDNHADFSNSATNWLSKHFLHSLIWKQCAHLINPYTTKFYGVLPARVDFLKDVYGLPEEKIELLVMGADDEKVKQAKEREEINNLRDKYNVNQNDFLIVTGGKIDNAKRQTLILMDAVKHLNNSNIKLLVFGSIIDELKEELTSLVDGNKIQYVGWIQSEEAYNYFAAADLVVFPGRHSVLWEQAVGVGVPCVFKHWEGTTHVDVDGNCEFIYNDSLEEITTILESLINNPKKVEFMKKLSETKGSAQFSYLQIAKKSIQLES